uniref:26S proteasome regulatory subunit Rpn7 N-terminal domain-containing protein n=1 Tax=Panagrolaimus sp. JU765 TaxID=591449 RepID=A0AC34QD21_9BILA
MDPEMVVDPDDDRMEDANPDDFPNVFSFANPDDSATISVSVPYLDLAKLEGEFNTPALLYRLLHMLEVCTNQKPEISKKILQAFRNSYDVEFIRKYNSLISNEIDCSPFSNSVLTTAENSSATSIDAAQAELKRWQDSGVKESIRTAMVQLFDAYFSSGRFSDATKFGVKESIRTAMVQLFDAYFSSGRFSDATKLYSKSIRDFSSSPRSVIPMLLDQIKGLMFMRDFSRVEIFLAQTERAIADCQQRESIANMEMNRSQSSSMYPRDDKLQKATMLLSQSATAKVAAVYGVVRMHLKQYKQAAEKFVQIDHEIFDYPELFATIDIAYYGCFCALATFDRQQLLDKVLNNGNFRKFMEPEGKLVDLIQAFRNNSFVTVFELLEQLRPSLLLNLYISKHVDNIYQLIRRRAF